MNSHCFFLLFAALGVPIPAAASPVAPPVPPTPPVAHTAPAEISKVSLSEVLPILQAHYVDFAELNYKPGDTLEVLLRRSQGAISLQPAAASPSSPAPILTTLLPGGMIYCRLASFRPATTWSDFAAQWQTWINSGAQGIILDLRSTATPDDFDGAAQFAGFFVPAGAPLFSVRDARPSIHAFVSASPAPHLNLGGQPITILINGRTSGAAEALATCLKANGALTIGRWTSGDGAQFEDHPLSTGLTLRYVAGEVTMADGVPLWRHSVSPDIGLLIDPAREEATLALIAQGKILDVIRESARSHRLSEASLVQGEDPAVDAYLVSPDKQPPVSQDSSLVTALDSLKAIRLSQRTTGASSTADDEPKIPSTAQ